MVSIVLKRLRIGVLGVAVLAMCSVQATAALVNVSNPLNVFTPSLTVATSSMSYGPASTMLDNLAADNTGDAPFFFGSGDQDQRVSISGFNSGLSVVRIFTVPEDYFRPLGNVTLRSSTTLTSSLVANDYETLLGTFSSAGRVWYPYVTGVSGTSRGYFDMPVSAPWGTRSLFIDIGPVGSYNYGTRIYEIQALVPEPSTMTLLATALVGLLGCAWRKRS